jgi:hypothetical protein
LIYQIWGYDEKEKWLIMTSLIFWPRAINKQKWDNLLEKKRNSLQPTVNPWILLFHNFIIHELFYDFWKS